MTTKFEPIFCSDCLERAVMHADGFVACSCSSVSDPDTDEMPTGWDTTRENIYAMQLAESDYQEGDGIL